MGIYQAGAIHVKTQGIGEFTRLKDRSAHRIIGKLKAQRGFVRIWMDIGDCPHQQIAERFR